MNMFVECPDDRYGLQCSEKCGACKNDERCDHVTGVCSNGCDDGRKGTKCDRGKHSIPKLRTHMHAILSLTWSIRDFYLNIGHFL